MNDATTSSSDEPHDHHGSPLSPGRGTGKPATEDPYTEAGAAVTQEWFGQSIERDTELADRLVAENAGDLEAAEAAFDEQATGAAEQAARRSGPPVTKSPHP